jgi:Calx-beta domain/FG-GAP-like repeat/Domain of unknown function (DUF4214)
MDLVIGANGSNAEGKLSILLGDGSGSFVAGPTSPITLPGQSEASGVAVADFNSDGKRDIAVATFTNGFFVLLGDGAGGFGTPTKVSSVSGGAVAAGDLNGDGKPDLAMGTFNGLGILLGSGSGGFSGPVFTAHPGGGRVSSVVIADVDGDGKPDVAAASEPPGGIGYFKGDGNGGFTVTANYLSAKTSNQIALGDFDGDGDLDIVAGESILTNTGGGVFEAARATYPATPGAGAPEYLAFGDFNADGRTDIAVGFVPLVGPSSSRLEILLRDAQGNFTRTQGIGFPGGTTLSAVIAADFNKDGKTDIAVPLSVSTPFSFVVSVYLSNGDGTFATPTSVNIGFQMMDLASGDFNNDGNPDLVATGLHGAVAVLLGNGSGGFSFGFAPGAGSFAQVTTADLNNDGKSDLIITDFSGQSVWTELGDGTGSFGNARSFAVGGTAAAVAVADFNNDGKIDVAVANQSPTGQTTNEGSTSVLLGDGTGGLAAAVNYPSGVYPTAIAVADFDGDGNSDLAVANNGASTISVLSGDGSGAFRNPINFNIWGQPNDLLVADFDADGHPDIATALMSSRTVGLMFGKAAAAQPCLLADDAAVVEGDAGTSPAQITVRLSQASAQVVTVTYVTKQGTAIDGQDFIGGGGSITFQPGETSKTIEVPIIGDTTDEFDEIFTVNLSGAVNARIGDGLAKVTITDNDPPPTISINDVSVPEGNFGSTFATFTLSLSAPSAKVVGVDFAAASGTATLGSDFDAAQGQGRLFFGSGATTQTINVPIRGDVTHEPDETFFINLSNPSDATIADGQGQGTILNDDPLPAITIFDASASEGTNADTTMSVTVRLANPSSDPVSVAYSFADGTATGGVDYVASPGTLTFNPGETQKTISVTVKDDSIDEDNETFFINLANPTNATITDGQALCTIFDNDGPTVSINDVSVVEGTGGTTNAVFTLTLSAASPQTILVLANTADGTATNSADYGRITNRNIVFLPGATTATLTVSIVPDAIIEADETFFVNLFQPSNCTIADGQGIGTILNDDVTSAQLSTDTMTVNESDGSVQITVQHIGDISKPFSVSYATFDGTAFQRSDYTAALGTLQFAAGEASKTITIFITDDAITESAENFFFSLGGPNGSRLGAPSSMTLTISANDPTPGPNPIDSPSFFVKQHYRDFLNRDPDQSGLDFWTGQITSCGSDAQCTDVKRINVSAAFFLSIEFQQTGYLVERFYKVAYGEGNGISTLGGVHQLPVPVVRFNEFLKDTQRIGQGVVVLQPGWEQALENNKQAYAGEFVVTSRFITTFPTTMTPAQFVDKLNTNAGNLLSASERATAIDQFGNAADSSNTTARAQAVRQVAENPSLYNAEFNRAFVLSQYFGYLRRNPNDPQDTDYTGYEFWLNKLNQFNGDYIGAEMVKAFISSNEYRQHFGP